MNTRVKAQEETNKPIFLSSDNFTPLHKTPWAGVEIATHYKAHLKLSKEENKIGESWEVSCDQSQPSRVIETQETLLSWVEKNKNLLEIPPRRHFDLLVKLLDAAYPLSLQVHPQDDDPFLTSNECGKHESWFILKAKPGSGLYLGFKEGVNKKSLEKVLLSQDDLEPLMNFVEVQEGDYFDIAPGIVHGIGAGVTLLEPQRVCFGKSGKTYRLWDWNRRYDSSGDLDLQQGNPRQLHIKECLRLIDPQVQSGSHFISQVKKKPDQMKIGDGGCVESYLANDFYQLSIISMEYGKKQLSLYLDKGYLLGCLLSGSMDISSKHYCEHVHTGRSFVLSKRVTPLAITAHEDIKLAVIRPTFTKIYWDGIAPSLD